MEEKARNQKKMSYWIEKEKELTNSCEIVIYWDVIRDRGQISLLQKLVNSLKVLPSIFEKHKICSNLTKSLQTNN